MFAHVRAAPVCRRAASTRPSSRGSSFLGGRSSGVSSECVRTFSAQRKIVRTPKYKPSRSFELERSRFPDCDWTSLETREVQASVFGNYINESMERNGRKKAAKLERVAKSVASYYPTTYDEDRAPFLQSFRTRIHALSKEPSEAAKLELAKLQTEYDEFKFDGPRQERLAQIAVAKSRGKSAPKKGQGRRASMA